MFDWSPAAEGGALILRGLDSAAEAGIRSILAVPLIEGEVPLGVFASKTSRMTPAVFARNSISATPDGATSG